MPGLPGEVLVEMLFDTTTSDAVNVSTTDDMRRKMPLWVLPHELITKTAEVARPFQLTESINHIRINNSTSHPQKVFFALFGDACLKLICILSDRLSKLAHQWPLPRSLRQATWHNEKAFRRNRRG